MGPAHTTGAQNIRQAGPQTDANQAAAIAATISGTLAQRVEVDAKEIRIMGSKSVLLHTLVAAD
jgi:hypothetical protein